LPSSACARSETVYSRGCTSDDVEDPNSLTELLDGQAIFSLSALFHVEESGLENAPPTPNAPEHPLPPA
jgi:hypothetical protein